MKRSETLLKRDVLFIEQMFIFQEVHRSCDVPFREQMFIFERVHKSDYVTFRRPFYRTNVHLLTGPLVPVQVRTGGEGTPRYLPPRPRYLPLSQVRIGEGEIPKVPTSPARSGGEGGTPRYLPPLAKVPILPI